MALVTTHHIKEDDLPIALLATNQGISHLMCQAGGLHFPTNLHKERDGEN